MRAALLAALVLAVSGAFFQSDERASPASVRVHVVDAVSRAPVENAIVVVEGAPGIRADGQGTAAFVAPEGARIGVRAPGFLRADARVPNARTAEVTVRLEPFRPKALYLSVYGVGDRTLRSGALSLIATTELNALVIDVKGDRGLVSYPTGVPLAAQVAAQRGVGVTDLAALVADLRSRGIYAIARIVVFKDDRLARARPDLALHTSGGAIFRDTEGLAWTNPYSAEVRDYNIALAREAAAAGFDEVQFDYLRFPDATGIVYDRPWTEANRVGAIDAFLKAAHQALEPYNVFIAADVFGYTCWNADDTRIGQKIERMAEWVDYLSPMLYPSGFQFGIPGYRNPIEHPHEIVQLTLERARERTGIPAVRFRPWLQAFRDYAFGGRTFDADEIRAQITAAEHFGADGWMLWNPRNQYSAGGLEP